MGILTVAKRVLIVDDDDTFRAMLTEQLALHDDFACEAVATAGAAISAAKGDYFDIILLDVGLPDIDGREACRMMRRAGVRSPIIMLTGVDTESDTILGLDSGANDYITKPFKLGVLLARIRAHIRQHERSDDAHFPLGPYTFQPANKLLIDNQRAGRKVRLTDKETAILKYFLRAGDRTVNRDSLLGEVWGYNSGVTTHTLETHIYRLRQKIERDPGSAELLVTEPGGYRLVLVNK